MTSFIRAQSAPWYSGIQLYIGSADKKTRVREIVLEKTDETLVSEPSFTLEPEQAQVMMDDLWNCGIRPTEGAGTAGAMKATERHLDDMRRIAFGQLNLPKEP